MSMHLVRVHYFVCGLRLMFSCLSGSIKRVEVLLSMPVLCCSVAVYQYHVDAAVAAAVIALDGV